MVVGKYGVGLSERSVLKFWSCKEIKLNEREDDINVAVSH
jgi:hypothetical protein